MPVGVARPGRIRFDEWLLRHGVSANAARRSMK
jgi:hypothetical protein